MTAITQSFSLRLEVQGKAPRPRVSLVRSCDLVLILEDIKSSCSFKGFCRQRNYDESSFPAYVHPKNEKCRQKVIQSELN